MVTISCAFRYSVSGRSTGTLISTAAPGLIGPGDALGQPRILRIGHDQGDGALSIFIISAGSMTMAVSRYKAPMENA
jgi:hypothetical protein